MRGSSFTTALTTTVGLTLTLILIGTLAVLGHLGMRWEQNLRSAARVQVYFQRDVDARTLDFTREILRTDAAVAEAVFLDAETASRELEDELGESFVDFLGYVPLPEAMDLTLRPAYSNGDSLRQLSNAWQDIAGVAEVVWPEALLTSFDEGMKRFTRPIALIASLFLIVSILLMNNTIRLSIFSKRFIIKTMQLVGARPRSIRAPFVISGVGIGLMSGLFAFAAILSLMGLFRESMGSLGVTVDLQALGMLAGLLIGGGILIGWLSTAVAVNRYLRSSADSLY